MTRSEIFRAGGWPEDMDDRILGWVRVAKTDAAMRGLVWQDVRREIHHSKVMEDLVVVVWTAEVDGG